MDKGWGQWVILPGLGQRLSSLRCVDAVSWKDIWPVKTCATYLPKFSSGAFRGRSGTG